MFQFLLIYPVYYLFCLLSYSLPLFWLWMVFLSYQISNFVIGLYFLSVVNKFGISSVYLGFSTICLLAVLYIAGNVVETKGRSLEEIERALNPAIWWEYLLSMRFQSQCSSWIFDLRVGALLLLFLDCIIWWDSN
jgi:hypothetical protein